MTANNWDSGVEVVNLGAFLKDVKLIVANHASWNVGTLPDF